MPRKMKKGGNIFGSILHTVTGALNQGARGLLGAGKRSTYKRKVVRRRALGGCAVGKCPLSFRRKVGGRGVSDALKLIGSIANTASNVTKKVGLGRKRGGDVYWGPLSGPRKPAWRGGSRKVMPGANMDL